MASEDAVRQLMHFADDIFKVNAITSPEIIADFCRDILNNGKLFQLTDDKFDVAVLAGLVSDGDQGEDASRNVYHLTYAVSPEHVHMMNVFHPQLKIVNGTDTSHPHATAQGHRSLDVRMMVREQASLGRKTLLDIGGNYITHPKLDVGRMMQVHCCTLRSGWVEEHRQTQRDVSVLQGAEECDKCIGGVQNCDYFSEHAICVHVLPEIPPDDWVGIFKRHGLKSVTSVHHYPTDIDNYERKGFMPYPGMHWKIGEDDIVEFHFDNDSSFSYKHRLDWLKEYGKPWVRTEPGWDYVIYYEVKVLEHGILYSVMQRMPASQVTMHSPHKKLLYVGGATDVMVPVPRFNPDKGYPITSPMAYDTVYYPVPNNIYSWCMMKGISNDTMKPEQPYSRNELRSALRAINRDRSLNGVQWSERLQMSTETCEIIADGIYTSIVMQTAYNKMLVSRLADQMQRMQRRWGHESLVRLMTRSVSLTVLLPYFMLSSEIQDAVDVMRVALSEGVYAHEALIPPQFRVPYSVLGEMVLPAGVIETDPEGFTHDVDGTPDVESDEFKKNYYYTFKDQLTDEQRSAMETHLFPHGENIPLAPQVSVENDDDVDDGLPSHEESWQMIVDNREAWLEEFNKLRAEADEQLYVDDTSKEPEIGTLQDVHKYDKEALLEYALHCFDLHQSTHKNALEMLSLHWSGTAPNYRNMKLDNEKDVGAVFINVDAEGYLIDPPDNVQYDQVIDPVTRTFRTVTRRLRGMHVGTTDRSLVYALNTLRIANSKRIGHVAMAVYKKGFDLSDVEVHLVDGIAGSGKTRTLTGDLSIKDVFGTAPRASAASVRKWCLTQERFQNMTTAVEQQFRTVDSHLLAKAPRQGENLYIDEGFMLPYGAIILLAVRCGAKRIYISGDNAQIGMIDRGAGYGNLLFTKLQYYTSIKYLNETDRCPQDMTYLMRDYYPEWRKPLIKTRSTVRRSVRVEVIPNAEAEVFKTPMPMSTVITYTQNDKSMTAKNPGFIDAKKIADEDTVSFESGPRPVLTVHESQGETYPMVVMHRLNKYSNAIFESLPHRYVGHSRHMVLLILRTVADASMCPLTKTMMRAVNLTDEQLDSTVSDVVNEQLVEYLDKLRTQLGKYVNVDL